MMCRVPPEAIVNYMDLLEEIEQPAEQPEYKLILKGLFLILFISWNIGLVADISKVIDLSPLNSIIIISVVVFYVLRFSAKANGTPADWFKVITVSIWGIAFFLAITQGIMSTSFFMALSWHVFHITSLILICTHFAMLKGAPIRLILFSIGLFILGVLMGILGALARYNIILFINPQLCFVFFIVLISVWIIFYFLEFKKRPIES